LVNCNDSLISNLNVSYTSTGISLYYCNNNTISGNTANYNNYIGIYLRYSDNNNIISGNSANNNIANGIWLISSNNNIISGNTANNNIANGIRLSVSDNNDIMGNTINNNYNGIYLKFSDSNTISGNIVNKHSRYGIYFRDHCDNNNIYLNCFTNNTINARDSGWNNLWDNGMIGNYWSDYTGFDADNNGIGDEPYNITGSAGSQDNFPLMNCTISAQDGGGIPIELIILISVISGGAMIGVATLILIRHKRKRIE
jgi:parallel beta-helix repeat protein